jgi:membrane protein
MIPKINVTTAFHILRDTFQGFIDNRALKLSASLPTIRFSLAPLLLLISLAIFLGREAIQGQVLEKLMD